MSNFISVLCLYLLFWQWLSTTYIAANFIFETFNLILVWFGFHPATVVRDNTNPNTVMLKDLDLSHKYSVVLSGFVSFVSFILSASSSFSTLDQTWRMEKSTYIWVTVVPEPLLQLHFVGSCSSVPFIWAWLTFKEDLLPGSSFSHWNRRTVSNTQSLQDRKHQNSVYVAGFFYCYLQLGLKSFNEIVPLFNVVSTLANYP